MISDREKWDARYLAEPGKWQTPDEFLERVFEPHIASRFPNGGRALDLAGGAGRNALWLAERGWQVTLVDVSPAGLALARARRSLLAAEAQVRLTLVEADLDSYLLPAEAFDLVTVIFFQMRELFPALRDSLRPGGLLLYKTYVQPEPGVAPEGFQLGHDELRQAFRGFQVLEERIVAGHKGRAVEFLARKPLTGT